MNEILNIEHNVKLLVLKALNKHQTILPAAAALGISDRTLKRYKGRFNIRWTKGQWAISEKGIKAKKAKRIITWYTPAAVGG